MWINQGYNRWIVYVIFAVVTLANQLFVVESYRLLVLIILLLLAIIFYLVDRRQSQ